MSNAGERAAQLAELARRADEERAAQARAAAAEAARLLLLQDMTDVDGQPLYTSEQRLPG